MKIINPTSAKNIEVAILIILKPPLINPTRAEANAINLLEIPALFIIEPARINKGIAINGNFIDPSNITIAVSIRKLVPDFNTIAIIVVTARPIAIGTFIDRINKLNDLFIEYQLNTLTKDEYLDKVLQLSDSLEFGTSFYINNF